MAMLSKSVRNKKQRVRLIHVVMAAAATTNQVHGRRSLLGHDGGVHECRYLFKSVGVAALGLYMCSG
jgi:hypothetical protein